MRTNDLRHWMTKIVHSIFNDKREFYNWIIQTPRAIHFLNIYWRCTVHPHQNSASIQSINQATNQSINQSINQPINYSMNQPINQSIIRWINQSINRSINRAINRTIDRSGFYNELVHLKSRDKKCVLFSFLSKFPYFFLWILKVGIVFLLLKMCRKGVYLTAAVAEGEAARALAHERARCVGARAGLAQLWIVVALVDARKWMEMSVIHHTSVQVR